METDHVLEAAKDAGGAHVIEAFLSSNASKKHKQRLVVKYVLHLLYQLLFICESLIYDKEIMLPWIMKIN